MAATIIGLYKNVPAGDKTVSITSSSGQLFPSPDDLDWSNPGYSFVKWCSTAVVDSSSLFAAPGEEIPREPESWYAIWEMVPEPYLVTNVELTATADAIRAKASDSATIEWESGVGFADAVAAIPSGGPSVTVEPLAVTENGTYTAPASTAYSPVTVNVPTGGGGTSEPMRDVNFYDFDGMILHSYSATDFLALTAMPENPSHDGLTAQGWNWNLTDAKTHVASYGKLNIGQMFITDDGKTRIYIHLEDGRLSPYLGICPNGTVDIDWGDGSAHDTVTGTSTSTIVNTQHTYAAAGDYVIKLTVTGTMGIKGDTSRGSYLLYKNSSTASQNRVYQNAVQKVEIGSGVTSIGSCAFYNCYSLNSVVIPDGVTSIGSYAFQNCYSLNSVVIPDSVTSIANYAFYNCYSLSSVVIPDSVTSIVTYAFGGCHSLNSVVIPDGVTSIGSYAFYNCYGLSSVVIPDGVTSIGGDAFQNCYSLNSVVIPDGVTSIGTSAFNGCYSLNSVVIPDSVTSIGSYAFYNCYGLASIRFEPTTPPTVAASNAFQNLPTDCIIYVPAGTLSAYTTATNYPSSSTYQYVEY